LLASDGYHKDYSGLLDTKEEELSLTQLSVKNAPNILSMNYTGLMDHTSILLFLENMYVCVTIL
jgi:hypothetical protein